MKSPAPKPAPVITPEVDRALSTLYRLNKQRKARLAKEKGQSDSSVR